MLTDGTSARPLSQSGRAARKRSNLTMTLAQHPQHYTQLPFQTSTLDNTPLAHRTRLITSATTRPRSGGAPRPARAAVEDATTSRSADGSGRQPTGTSPVTALACLKPHAMARPHSAGHRWMFLTQETLHPAFASSTGRGPRSGDSAAERTRHGELHTSPKRAAEHSMPMLKTTNTSANTNTNTTTTSTTTATTTSTSMSTTRTSFNSTSRTQMAVDVGVPFNKRTQKARGGRPPLASPPRARAEDHRHSLNHRESPMHTPSPSVDAEDTHTRLPPAYLLNTLARAARQGEGLHLKTPFSMLQPHVEDAREAATATPGPTRPGSGEDGEEVSWLGSATAYTPSAAATGPAAPMPAGTASSSSAAAPPPAAVATVAAATGPRASPESSPMPSDEARVAHLWALSALHPPLAAPASRAQRQAGAAPSGLLVEDRTDPATGHEASAGPGAALVHDATAWTAAEYTEAQAALRRVWRHLPPEHHSVLAQRLKQREEWCAHSLHDYRPLVPDKMPDDTLRVVVPAANIPTTASADAAAPPTWTPSRPTSRTSSIQSNKSPLPLMVPSRAAPDDGADTTPLFGSSPGSPLMSAPLTLPPRADAVVHAPLESTGQHDAVTATASRPSLAAVSGDGWLPVIDPYARTAALASAVPPPTTDPAVVPEAVLTELPAAYAQLLVQAAAERRAHVTRNRSLYDLAAASSETRSSGAPQRASHTTCPSTAVSHAVSLPPRMPIPMPPPPPPPPPLAATARKRVSLPFSPDEDVPGAEGLLSPGSRGSPGQPLSSPFPTRTSLEVSGGAREGAWLSSVTPPSRPLSRASARLSAVRFAESSVGEAEELTDLRLHSLNSNNSASSGTGSGQRISEPILLSHHTSARAQRTVSLTQRTTALTVGENNNRNTASNGDVDDDNRSEDSELAAQHRAEAEASIAVYRGQLHGAITRTANSTNTALTTPTTAITTTATATTAALSAASTVSGGSVEALATLVSPASSSSTSPVAITAAAPALSVASSAPLTDDKHVVPGFTANSRLDQLSTRFRDHLEHAAEVHLYTNAADRRRLLAMADAFSVQRLQQIVPRLHPVEDVNISELDPWYRQEQAQRAEATRGTAVSRVSSAKRQRHGASRKSETRPYPSCGGVFPLTEAWQRADDSATAMGVFLLDLKRDDAHASAKGLRSASMELARSVEQRMMTASSASPSCSPSRASSGSELSSRRASRSASRPRHSAAMAEARPGRLSLFVSSSYRTDPAVSELLATHEDAVLQAEKLQEAMEKSFNEMLLEGEPL